MTGFLVLGISKSSSIDTKFDGSTMYLFSLDPLRDGYTPENARALFEKLPERLRAAAGVRRVALAAEPPFSSSGAEMNSQLTAEGSPDSAAVRKPVLEQIVGADYFATLGETMLAGREFAESDQRVEEGGTQAVALPAVLNESAERKLFGNQNGIGKRVRDEKRSYEVVGLVRDMKDIEGISEPIIYLPLTPLDFARPQAGGMTILVRSDAGADGLRGIHDEIAFLAPNVNIFNEQTLGAYLERGRSSLQFSLQSYGAIGLFGLVLAAIGLAGVTAYAVAQRRKEIAIRTALGASRAQVLRLVLREGASLVCAGTVLGFLGAMAMAKVLSALASMFVDALRFGTTDPLLLIGAPLLLAAVAMLACYLPARRSATIDPLKALREE